MSKSKNKEINKYNIFLIRLLNKISASCWISSTNLFNITS